MTTYRSTYSVRLLEDGTAFRITYWHPASEVRRRRAGITQRKVHPGFRPPMSRYRGRTVCPTSGKLRYGSLLIAQQAIAQALLSGNPRRHETRAYWCEDCEAWHLTSKDAIQRIRRTA